MTQPAKGPTLRWRSVPAETIRWVVWEDTHIAYHHPSGMTHFLNDSSRMLLDDLLDAPMTAEEVAARFSDAAAAIGEDAVEEARALLERFEELGIVVQV